MATCDYKMRQQLRRPFLIKKRKKTCMIIQQKKPRHFNKSVNIDMLSAVVTLILSRPEEVGAVTFNGYKSF